MESRVLWGSVEMLLLSCHYELRLKGFGGLYTADIAFCRVL